MSLKLTKTFFTLNDSRYCLRNEFHLDLKNQALETRLKISRHILRFFLVPGLGNLLFLQAAAKGADSLMS